MDRNFLTPGFVPGSVTTAKLPKNNLQVNTQNNRFENRKVPLAKGKSLNDWIRLQTSGSTDLSGTNGKVLKVTEEDMKNHSDQSNAWVILNGKVYNVAPYMEYHPGGVEELMRGAGTDATGLFNEIHPWVAWESMLKNSFVGHYVGRRDSLRIPDQKLADIGSLSVTDGLTAPDIGFKYHECLISCVEKVTHDTNYYILEASSSDWPKVVPLGSHVFFKLTVDGVDITRPYTMVPDNLVPTGTSDGPPNLCFVIKLYSEGLFTKQFKKLTKGDKILVSDIVSPFSVEKLKTTDSLLVFAAGTGITPFLRIINEFISTRNIRLYFFNKTRKDIICEELFTKLSKDNPSIFSVQHVLSVPDDQWNGPKGRVNEDLMQKCLQLVDLGKTFALVCGPTGFNNECLKLLLKLEWPEEKSFIFSG